MGGRPRPPHTANSNLRAPRMAQCTACTTAGAARKPSGTCSPGDGGGANQPMSPGYLSPQNGVGQLSPQQTPSMLYSPSHLLPRPTHLLRCGGTCGLAGPGAEGRGKAQTSAAPPPLLGAPPAPGSRGDSPPPTARRTEPGCVHVSPARTTRRAGGQKGGGAEPPPHTAGPQALSVPKPAIREM